MSARERSYGLQTAAQSFMIISESRKQKKQRENKEKTEYYIR